MEEPNLEINKKIKEVEGIGFEPDDGVSEGIIIRPSSEPIKEEPQIDNVLLIKDRFGQIIELHSKVSNMEQLVNYASWIKSNLLDSNKETKPDYIG